MFQATGKQITVKQLKKLPTRVPKDAGEKWHPIPHGELMEAILLECERRGWKAGEPTILLSQGGTQMDCCFDLDTGRETDPDLKPCLAVFNSNLYASRSFPPQVYGGVRVYSEDVSVPFDRYLIGRHLISTLEDLGPRASQVLDQFARNHANYGGLIANLDARKKTHEEAMNLVCQAAREGTVRWQKVGVIDGLLMGQDPSLWRIILATIKGGARASNPFPQVNRAWKFVEYVRRQCF